MAAAQAFPRCGDAYGAFRIPVNTHRMAADERSVLYFIQSLDLVKVGIAADLEKRVRTFQLGNPHPLDVKSRSIPRALAKQVEQRTHMALAEFYVGREWFRTNQAAAIAAATPIIQRAWRAVEQMDRDGVFLGMSRC